MITAFPVDTHIFRVTKRLGWVPENATYEKAHPILGALISPDRYYPLHINLIRHGRAIWMADIPRCPVCPLTDMCAYYRKADAKKMPIWKGLSLFCHALVHLALALSVVYCNHRKEFSL